LILRKQKINIQDINKFLLLMSKKSDLKMKSWYSDKYQMVVVQRNLLSFFALFAIIAVTVSVVFVKQITASKSLEPYVIEIEDKTGIPTVVEQLKESQFTADMTLKRYFLFSFIKAVEGYNPATYRDDYRKAALFSTPKVFRQFRNSISSKSETSPFTKLGRKGMIIVRLKSIQFTDPNSAQVRFRLETRGRTTGFKPRRDMIAYVEFKFANLNLTLEERFINPIGFQVGQYSVDDELIRGFEERNNK
jgi:type IV secretion system protein VirB8